MGAHEIFTILAVFLGIATVAILIVTKRVKNIWYVWLSVPVVAFVWYWLIVCLYMGSYFLRINNVR
jgi:hypothetical protein